MRTLAALLLALIAVVHYGGDHLATLYEDVAVAQRGIYYVARSFEGVTQYAVIGLLAIALRREKLLMRIKATEPGSVKGAAVLFSSATGLVAVVCCWGAIEHLQAGVCRLSLGVSNRVPSGPPLTGICDDLTGLPLYALGMGVVAFIAAVIAAHPRET